MDSTAELEHLRAAYADLQRHVARLSVLQQELIHTRDRLDRELARFGGIHSYNTKALGVRDEPGFALLSAETIVELFDLEFGVFWSLDDSGALRPAPVGTALAALETLHVGRLRELIEGPGLFAPSRPRAEVAMLWHSDDHPLLPALGLHSLVIAPCTSGGKRYAWIIGGVTEASADFYSGIDEEQIESFTVFAQQVGALLQNRASKATIEAQVEQLRLDEERLSLALDGSNVGLWDWDLRTNRVYFSDQWKGQIGYRRDEIGDNISEWQSRIHPQDLARSNARVEEYMQGLSAEYENIHRLRHKDGHFVWIMARGRALRDEHGRVYRVTGIHVDVSEQKSIAEKFKAIFKYSSDGYLLIDRRLRIVDSNPVSNRWFALESDSATVGKLFEMAPEQGIGVGRERGMALVERAFEEGFMRFEWTFSDRRGRPVPTEVTLVPISLDDRPLLFASIHDLTERKAIEEALRRSEIEQREAREQAETANRAKSAFLATTSHEIRTPMNGVLGMLQLLEDDPLTDKQHRYVTMAKESAGSLLAIIDDILDLSKVEAGRLELEAIPFDPSRMITDLTGLFREPAERRGLDLTLSFARRLPSPLIGDPVRLRQVLTNLIGNAIKFTPRGSVDVDVGGRPLADGRFGLVISVRDTGIGIDPETQKRLFRPFTQADSTTTRRYGGTGLGLAICRKLIDLMGGQIGITSNIGAGSLFRVEVPLPVGTASQIVAAEPLPVKQHDLSGRRVLLVEDNPTNQAVARSMLKKLGILVTTAGHGGEALALLESAPPFDVVLMDIQMPVMDGLEATRRLRTRERALDLAPVTVVALTANAMEEDRLACLEAGMDEFLPKPINKNGLRDLLMRLMERREPAGSADAAAAPASPCD